MAVIHSLLSPTSSSIAGLESTRYRGGGGGGLARVPGARRVAVLAGDPRAGARAPGLVHGVAPPVRLEVGVHRRREPAVSRGRSLPVRLGLGQPGRARRDARSADVAGWPRDLLL